jgi:hypothetical protein
MFGGIIGGIVSSVVGSVVSNVAGSLLSNLVGQFGGSNVFGALANLALNSLGDALKGVINNAPIPQFLKDAANSVIDGVLGNNQQPTTPECQCAVEDSMGDAIMNAATSAAEQAGEDADKEGAEGGNWLVALARGLADVQEKFLSKAMENLDTMKASTGEDNREEFLTAQSEYQANTQMFNMMANMTATSLKSIGEGLTSIARKQ